jgi:transposase InsO family protein
LTDNRAEFAARASPQDHPFEQMLIELGIKHRYTRPYRPQTNGNAERFWRTLDEDVIRDATFENLEHFANELLEYMIYYSNHRPHQAIGGLNPKAFADQKISIPRSGN